MKIYNNITLFVYRSAIFLPMLLTGCIAKSKYVEHNAKLISALADKVDQLHHDPVTAAIANNAQAHANESASIIPQAIGGIFQTIIGAVTSGTGIGAALTTLASGLAYTVNKRLQATKIVAREAGEMTPALAKVHLEKNKIK